ncbi:MAG: c-type cytochrome, partial [Gemmatimonadota bacterium]|nr:c-type cytochrome [Gemmatimonadota bacterium]
MSIANRLLRGPSAVRARSLAALALLPFLSLVSPAEAQELPEPAQSAAAGARVFGDAGCVECHAVRGLGGQTATDLASLKRRSFYDLATALWNHLPEMADRLRRRRMEIHLSPREAGDLFAFLYSI